MNDPLVEHVPGARQFRATVEGMVSVLDYERVPGEIHFLHVGVPEPLRRRGIAGQVTRFALEFARAERLAVVPICPYVADFIERNPEYQELVRGA